MPYQESHRRGRVAIAVLAILALTVLAGFMVIRTWNRANRRDDPAEMVLHTVQQGNFEAFITEPGDVASSRNVEIRCSVRSRGTAGTSILKVAEEGTNVTEGDFLVQFDDSLLKNELTEQKIVAANDKAALIQAQSDLDTAERTLREYEQGLFEQERQVIESELFVAEEEARRSAAHLEFSRRLNAFGFITAVQLKADEFAVQKAKKDVAAAKRKLDVYDRFTKDKMVGEYKAEIEKQKANLEAARFTLDLSKQKLATTEEQIKRCYVTAPSDGQVVHANMRDRRGDGQVVIEEGTLIRDGQVVIRLPDVRQMEVHVRINESHVNRVRPDQPCEIELEADPDSPLRGKVKEVAPYPFPIRWHGSPLEYGCKITIVDPPATIRPGLRAKAKIFFEMQDDVLQVPIASVIEHQNRHYCLVRRDGKWLPQLVQIGSNNNSVAIVKEGLQVGDRVALTPFRHINRSELPSLPETPVARRNRSASGSTSSSARPSP